MNKNGYVVVHGKRYEVFWRGPSPKEAPTLIFLHEGLGCAAMWRDFPDRLAAATGCGALVYSRLGYGGSDPCELPRPTHFMHDEGQKVLPELLKVAGVQKCILVGHSDGGSIAIIFAGIKVRIPILGLILESAHVFCEEKTLDSIRKAVFSFNNGNLRRKLEKYHGDNTDNAFWGWSDAWLHPEFKQWNLSDFVSRIKVPALVIQGENDEYGTTAQVESINQLAETEVDVLMIHDCGHLPHQEQEVVVFNKMKKFINRLIE